MLANEGVCLRPQQNWSKDLKLASQEELNTYIDNFLSTHSQHLKSEALINLVYKE